MKPKAVALLTTALIAIALLVPGKAMKAQGPPPPPPGAIGPGGWDAPPDGFSDVMRHGFADGVQAARGDFSAGLAPDPRRSGLFRHPPVPPPARNDYRDAFGKGYQVAMQHLASGGPGYGRGYDHGAPPPPNN